MVDNQIIGFLVITISFMCFLMFIFGNDLELKEQVKILCAFSGFFIAIAIGARLIEK